MLPQQLVGRRTSNGVFRFDFGRSWRLNRDRPVTDLFLSPPAQNDHAGVLPDCFRWVGHPPGDLFRGANNIPGLITSLPRLPLQERPCRPFSSVF